MKRIETIFKKERLFAVVMLLCFLYGGYSILSFFFQAYGSFAHQNGFGESNDLNFFNGNNSQYGDSNFFRAMRPRSPRDRLEFIYAPLSLSYLFGGIVSLLAGFSLFLLLKENEHKEIKRKTASELLLPDEKKVIGALKEAGHEMKQSRLVLETGMSKVQAHRAIKRLEAKGIVEKHQYGLTNKVILKKEIA